MPRIVSISWKKFEKFLFFVGCDFMREKGDHRIYNRPGLLRPIIVPRKNNLPVFIILNNLRVLGISPAEYVEILERI